MRDEAERPRRQVYGRGLGPRLRPNQKARLARVLPMLRIDVPATGRLDPGALFDEPVGDLWLEIGFGGGEHLAGVATAHPNTGLIGVEPYIGGVAKLVAHCEALGLRNVRIVVDDARLLLAALPDACLGRLYVLFPDPWPKTRHHKRRIVNPTTAAEFVRLLRPAAELRLATDDRDYARWMLAVLLAEPGLAWLAEDARGWRRSWPNHPTTRYEAKARAAGREPTFLRFRRVSEKGGMTA